MPDPDQIAEPLLNERLPATKPIRQKNDYAISKWVNELQIMNFEERYSNRVMRLRFFNCYGPCEHYHNYRSVVCLFCYRALHGLRYEVYEGYHRVFQYIDDFIPTLANATDFFRPGAVCNIGGAEYRSVREMSDIVLRTVGRDDSIVSYLSEDKHNTVNKCPDITLATLLLGHNPTTTLEKGIPLTIDWMRKTYGVL